MSFRRVILAVAVASFMVTNSHAADWPAKPVRIIVPYPAGGGTDIAARLVGAKLSEALKQPFVVENKTGASGTIAGDYVLKSPADGHTVLFESQSIAVTPAITRRMPYDSARDFQPVAQLITQAFVIVATPKLPVKNLRDVVAYSTTKPNGLNAAVPGSGTYLTGEYFKRVTNTRMTFIPYKGGAHATVSLLSGETDIGFMDVPSIATNITAGKVNALAVTTAKRVKLIPDMPTAAEAGMPDFKVEGWLGVFVAAGTPADIVNRLNAECNIALANPEITARIAQIGGDPSPSTVADFTKLYRAELALWKDVVARAKVTVQ